MSTGSSVPARTRNSSGTCQTAVPRRTDRDRPLVDAGPGIGRRPDRQPEPPRQALGHLHGPAGHDQPRADRVDGSLRGHAADAVRDVTRRRSRGPGSSRRARSGRRRSTVTLPRSRSGTRATVTGSYSPANASPRSTLTTLGLEGRVVVGDVLHRDRAGRATKPRRRSSSVGRSGSPVGAVQDALEVVVEVEPALGFHVIEERSRPGPPSPPGRSPRPRREQAQFSPWNSRFNWPSVTSTSNCFSWK